MSGSFDKPGPQHERLRSLTGAWSARIKYYPSPGADPIESTGEFLSRIDLGGYFLLREMNFGLQGFQGQGLTGYDVFQQAYVGTWVDSTSPIIYQSVGHFDEGGSFHETMGGPGPDGKPTKLRAVTEFFDKNRMLFRMYLLEGSKESIALEIEHTRRRFLD